MSVISTRRRNTRVCCLVTALLPAPFHWHCIEKLLAYSHCNSTGACDRSCSIFLKLSVCGYSPSGTIHLISLALASTVNSLGRYLLRNCTKPRSHFISSFVFGSGISGMALTFWGSIFWLSVVSRLTFYIRQILHFSLFSFKPSFDALSRNFINRSSYVASSPTMITGTSSIMSSAPCRSSTIWSIVLWKISVAKLWTCNNQVGSWRCTEERTLHLTLTERSSLWHLDFWKYRHLEDS